ncbi:MAG: hypothetical protein ACREET_14335 [Stellaceae bacterium]
MIADAALREDLMRSNHVLGMLLAAAAGIPFAVMKNPELLPRQATD